MDTRYWGPSGWKLLHSISFSYTDSLKKEYKDFFNAVAYILPCKFCRKSYSEYIIDDPVEKSLDSKEQLTKWLWRIHNKVNEKLRSQRLCNYEDPPFTNVKKIYEEKLHQGCSKVHFEGWEFLFSIVEGHPYSKLSLSSKPFAADAADVPVDVYKTPLEENMYNKMKPIDRMVYYKLFWTTLAKVLPFKEWRDLWKKYDKKTYDSRSESLKNLYSIRCSLEKDLELQNKTKFSSLCKELSSYKSGCNKSVRSKTCRRKK